MDAPNPIVIHRSANRNGETFALESDSRERLENMLGSLPANARIFIGHDTRFDYEHIHGSFVPQVVALLTGISEERLQEFGGVVFRDPVTEKDIQVTKPEARAPSAAQPQL